MNLEIVVITGMSGSGKSVALNALEDAGYYCVDNLPPELLASFVELELQQGTTRVAVAMDVRSATALPQVPRALSALRMQGLIVRPIFLDATTDTLVRRFSETRRRHPLTREAAADQRHALVESIEIEREMLAELREGAHIVDTSAIRAAQLQGYVKSLVQAPAAQLTLVFESFAFKRGIPVDADFVFDARSLPNPHYEAGLRRLTGRDDAVMQWLDAKPQVTSFRDDVRSFLDRWLPSFAQDHRSYVTVAVGCTGGQHRSVYLVEMLADAFSREWTTLTRHRELDAFLAGDTRY